MEKEPLNLNKQLETKEKTEWEFKRITPESIESKEYQEALAIYLEFPADERREPQDLEKIIREEKDFSFLTILDKNKEIIGMMGIWNFDEMSVDYLEHIAIRKDLRSKGIGTKIIQNFIRQRLTNNFLVLEVEPPELGAIEAKRIKWYQRLGFKIAPFEYLQPAYSPDKKPVPLKFLYYAKNREILHQEKYNQIRELVYKRVYKFSASI